MTEPPRILVVEDRDSLRRLLERALGQAAYQVDAVATVAEAVGRLAQASYDLVLTDLKLPDDTGIEVLRASKEARPNTPVLVMTAFGSVSVAVEAKKLGAADFHEKPVELDELLRRVGAQLAGAEAVPEALVVPGGVPIVGRHPRLRAALRMLEQVAVTDSTVLLLGESGTGKELFARALHALSGRSAGRFVALNCAAIPEPLLENELFGHEKGAFTGASRRSEGVFERTAKGTLLLDEIGELGLGVQAKVLRVLEERTFQRIGGGPLLRADVRLVAATNRDLRSMVEEGTFRSDLYFRLDVFPIELPPLRERRTDIPLIAGHLVRAVAQRHHRPAPTLSAAAGELLMAEEWPGNVRQLANVLERAVILSAQPVLDAADIEPLLKPLSRRDDREAVRQALRDAEGDKKRAAELLGMSYRTLLRRVSDYDLKGFPHYRDP